MEPYIGEIRPIAFAFAPKGWAFCTGQLLPIAQNQALYSLLGTTFGGNGQTTFGLPDLRGRIPVGLSANYVQGQQGGVENVTLATAQVPAHTHGVTGTLQTSDSPEADTPVNNLPAAFGRKQFTDGAANAPMAALTGTTGSVGGNQAHSNRQPYLAINYAIALVGIYPSRG